MSLIEAKNDQSRLDGIVASDGIWSIATLTLAILTIQVVNRIYYYLIPLKRNYQYKILEIELNRAKKLSVRWSSKITSEAVLATQRDFEKISKPPVYSK